MRNNTFEESYFKGHYCKNTGNFQKKDLQKLFNWYWGWITYFQRYVDLQNGAGKNVLEVGCGIAPISKILSERGFQTYASDISSYAIENTKKLQKNTIFFIQDITIRKTISKKFDIIIACEVVEHINSITTGLKNLKKMLKKDGVIILSTPFPCKKAYDDPTHINVHEKEYWEEQLQKVGFIKTVSFYLSFLPFLYFLDKRLSIALPMKIPWKYINSTTILIAWNK